MFFICSIVMNIICLFRTWPYSCIWLCNNSWLYQLLHDLVWLDSKCFLWPRKGSLMKTRTRILDNRLYYTRKIDLHRKCKKSRSVRIAPILICGIWCTPHLTGMYGTRPFFGWDRAQGRSPHAPGVCQKCPRPCRHSPC